MDKEAVRDILMNLGADICGIASAADFPEDLGP